MAREIRYTARWKVTLGYVLWAAITGTFLYFSATQLYDDYCFTHHAVPITGTVLQKTYRVNHGRHNSVTYTYYIQYRYQAGNVTGVCEQNVQGPTYGYLQTGGPVPVMYLPENPAKVRVNLVIEERAKHWDTGILCTAAAFFLFGGGFVLGRLSLTNVACQRLQREGIVTNGVVTNIGVAYVGKARTPKAYLEFEYRDSMGATQSGKSLYLTDAERQRWKTGDSIAVRYDRNRPGTFMIELG